MKQIVLILLAVYLFATGCSTSKSATQKTAVPQDLEGTWELVYILGPRIAFTGLYPDKKPMMKITVEDNRITGNTSCNAYSGPLSVNGNRIDFSQPFITTKMACPGEGEAVFLETLKKITSYSLSDNKTLHFIMGDIALMRFVRK